MRNVSLLLICVSILLWVSAGCNEDPVAVGEGILPPEDFVEIDTLIVYANESFTFEHPVLTSGATNIFAGENEDVRVEGIFKFNELITDRNITPDTVLGSHHFDATLFLYPAYYFGDSTETVSLSLYEVRSGWSTTGFTREIFETLEQNDDPVSSGSIMLGDTNAIAFPIPRDLIHKWALLGEQSLIPQGLIMKSNEPANGIIGFRGLTGDNAPQLRIVYGTEESQDTITFSSNTRAFAAYLKKEINLDNAIITQAGTVTRAVVRFNLDGLPPGVLIHNAVLEMTRDPALSLSHPVIADSLAAYHILDPFKLVPRIGNEGQFTKTVIDTVTEVTRYRAAVSEIVQRWATVDENNGFIIRDYNETVGFHRTSFFTENAEEQSKRPRLIIIYSRL